MTATQPVAFVYDRRAMSQRELLEARLRACARYISAQGWGFGGWWVDEGEHALTDHRPEFDRLLTAVREAECDRPRVCLIYGWNRLAHSNEIRGVMTRRVLLLGGWVETCQGEKRTPDGRYTQVGRLTSGPITA
ncbi:recombinase family protein [Streptantibioticus ferralitis]|uniref:Recombinase family protein n=1 Tax=Streptantibioticus ferralitis TaxID=236510 RepID=A0ABT5Z809_9ACTN|nr:recombinase family protein [Streptantibioticus ferralitis]MDF2259939.1 recombinase family protein [Streptantibioticus ferralitis]